MLPRGEAERVCGHTVYAVWDGDTLVFDTGPCNDCKKRQDDEE